MSESVLFSQNMLPPRLYDWECREVLGRTDQDVGFWLDVARSAPAGTAVLELACGTGRVTLPLALAGIEVVGLDIDPAALAVARRRRDAAAGSWPLLVAADMRRFALRRRFGAVIIPYNSFQLLTDAVDAAACLATVSDHLAPAGTFALEVTDFQDGATRDEVPEELVAAGQLDGEPITLSGSLAHDRRHRRSRYRRRFATADWVVTDEVVLRSYRPDELESVLEAAGLASGQWWQDGAVTRVVATPA
jgi:SAM-dependent methyltransferase